MTYAGLKSMIYAGLDRNDPRVKAALTYITQHYTLDENPGLGQQGLYYYYHTFAKTMAVLGEPTLVDAKGVVARLEGRAGRGAGQAAGAQRRLGQPRRPVHGRRSQPGHRLCPAGAGLHAEEVIGAGRHGSVRTCRRGGRAGSATRSTIGLVSGGTQRVGRSARAGEGRHGLRLLRGGRFRDGLRSRPVLQSDVRTLDHHERAGRIAPSRSRC